jgi:hypothetical protein
MSYCQKCGALNGEGAGFCASCGTPIQPVQSAAGEFGQRMGRDAQDFARRMQQEGERISERTRREVEWRVGREPPEVYRNEGMLGAISAGAVMVIIALTFIRFPGSFTVLGDYFTAMGDLGRFVRPPAVLLDGAVFFFAAVGLWSLLFAILRLLVQRSARKALGDAVGGAFSFYVAYVVSAYAALSFGGVALLAYLIVGLGMLAIAHAAIALALPWPRRP